MSTHVQVHADSDSTAEDEDLVEVNVSLGNAKISHPYFSVGILVRRDLTSGTAPDEFRLYLSPNQLLKLYGALEVAVSEHFSRPTMGRQFIDRTVTGKEPIKETEPVPEIGPGPVPEIPF